METLTRFIQNHTNNALRVHTHEYNNIIDNGFKIAAEGLKFQL